MRAGNALDTRLRAAIEVFEAGELDRALHMVQRLCHHHPRVAIVHNVHGVIAAEKGDFQAAIDSYRRAISLDPDNCDVHFNLGNVLRDKGDLKPAVASYRAALRIRPDDPDVVFNMASVLRELGQLNAAEKLFQQLAEIAPGDHTVHSKLGSVLFRLGRTEEAKDCFREALKLSPGFVEAHDSLCDALEKAGQIDDLRKAVAAARVMCPPDDIRIAIRRARLLRHDDELEGARKVLAAIVKFHPGQAQLNSACWRLHGDICDRLEDAPAAYRAFVEANIWAAKGAAGRGLEPAEFLQKLDDLQATCKTVSREPTPEPAEKPDALRQVFLIGFPLSGSSRLARVLERHSHISVVAGKPMVEDMARQAGEGLNPEELTDEQVRRLRSTYMASLNRHLPDQAAAGDVVIDALPLNIVHAGLICRVFPDATFLIALRHPCDCVLDCFMHDFELDDAMANFLDLKSAAQCYDKVMSLWFTCIASLHLPVHAVKVEQLDSDPEQTVRDVLTHLHLDWEKSMAGGKTRHSQAGKPGERKMGRWRRYRAHMVPVLPTLLKWAEIHGYSNNPGNS